MERIEKIIKALARKHAGDATIIVCLFTGTCPPSCAPMPRFPTPETGMPFDDGFPSVLADVVRLNPSVHDGAVMVGRIDASSAYRVTGWSFRLFAGDTCTLPSAMNRGSAFNSCLSMSTINGVDRIYLASRNGLERFEKGTWSAISLA
jgi:hypothetical protein